MDIWGSPFLSPKENYGPLWLAVLVSHHLVTNYHKLSVFVQIYSLTERSGVRKGLRGLKSVSAGLCCSGGFLFSCCRFSQGGTSYFSFHLYADGFQVSTCALLSLLNFGPAHLTPPRDCPHTPHVMHGYPSRVHRAYGSGPLSTSPVKANFLKNLFRSFISYLTSECNSFISFLSIPYL